MTDAPTEDLEDVHPAILAALTWNQERYGWLDGYWLDPQNLRTTMIRLCFRDKDDQKLIVEAIATIARAARRERIEHRKTGLARIEFQPKYSPPASSGQPPTISAGDLKRVLESARTIERLRKRSPQTLSRKALFRCRLFVDRLIAERPA